MRILSKKILKDFMSNRNASIIEDTKVVFNAARNRCRLIVTIKYYTKIVFIKFIGMHKKLFKEIDVPLIDLKNITKIKTVDELSILS